MKKFKDLEFDIVDIYRRILKKLLECIWYLEEDDPKICKDFLPAISRDHLLLTIFKEIMKNEAILVQYYTSEFRNEIGLDNMVTYYLGSFPHSTTKDFSFIKLIDVLMGSSSMNLSLEILDKV